MVAPARYYTFAPGKAPANRQGDQIKLQPGQQLHFKAGKGYYAGPAITVAPRSTVGQLTGTPGYGGGFVPHPPAPRKPVRPVAPVAPVDPMAPTSPSDIDAQATAQANAALTPQEQEIQRQQQMAAQQAKDQEAAIAGFSEAAAQLEGQIAPEVSSAYSTATQDQGQLGAGLATGVGQDLQAQQDSDKAFAASQGQQTADTTNVGAEHDTVQMLQGVLPGQSLAAEGAAATREAAGVPQIQLNAGAQSLEAAMATARSTNDTYAQQLIQVAAQFPAQKAAALQALNQYELDKANYREQVAQNKVTNRQAQENINLQTRAEAANERAAGVAATNDANKNATTLANDQANLNYKWATLDFKNKQEAAKAQAAARAGKTIDVAASKLLGHIVYKDGTEDPSIKVKQPASANTAAGKAKQTALKNRSVATQKASVKAYEYGTKLLGTPVVNKTMGKGLYGGKGRYLAAPGATGVFPGKPNNLPPATTNNPAKAMRTGAGASTYAEAQQKVWGEIGGDQLMAHYGYSRQQVLTIINRALARAGWKAATKKPRSGAADAHHHDGP